MDKAFVTTPSPTLVIEWRRGRTREGQRTKNTNKNEDVVVLRANTNEPNDLGAARTGIRDGEPGDGIPRGLVQQTRPLVLREMHR